MDTPPLNTRITRSMAKEARAEEISRAAAIEPRQEARQAIAAEAAELAAAAASELAAAAAAASKKQAPASKKQASASKKQAPAAKASAAAAPSAPTTEEEAQEAVDNELESIQNRITNSQASRDYYNSLDNVIFSIVELMKEWPRLTSMAGSSADIRLYVSSKISTLFLNIIQDWLGALRPTVRSTLLLGEDTDAECRKARQNARDIALADPRADPSPVLGYTVISERRTGSTGRGNPPIVMSAVEWGISPYDNMDKYVPKGTPGSNKINQFVKASKNSWAEDANPLGTRVQRGNCGNCWLCSEPVYFYKNGAGEFTGCGQCEHMGAIIGTIISYMTANLENNYNSAYGYATSHTWCNQVKTDILPMRFGESGWIKDDDGIGEIAKRIMGIGISSEWNYQEYDPLQWKRIYDWGQLNINSTEGQAAYTKIVASITAGTELWCRKANDNLKNVKLSSSDTTYKASGAPGIIQNLTRIITYVLEDTTDQAIKGTGVGVWGAKKKGGSIGNIYPESVSSSEKITDKNIYKDINKKIDEKSDKKSDEKSDIIDLNNIYNRALGVTIKNKEDLIKVIYDVLTKLYENKNGTYVPMFNKLLTNLKNSLIEKNKSNSKNTIEKYDTSIRDLKVDNNSYVNPINTNNNVLVESRGGKRNTKKRNARKRNTKKRNTKKRNARKRNTKKRNQKNRK